MLYSLLHVRLPLIFSSGRIYYSNIRIAMMKGDPQFVVLKYQAWLDASQYEKLILGAIVKDPLSPSTNYVYVSREDEKSNNTRYQTGSATDFLLANDTTKAEELAASVTRLAGFAVASTTEDRMQLAGKFIRFKRIEQLDDFWETLKRNETVSKTAIDWVAHPGPWPPCLVVGIMLCEDVELCREGLRSREVGGETELPIAQVALPAGVPDSIGYEVNPKVSLGCSTQNATIFGAKFGEKRIFALELRKITTQPLRRRRLQLKNYGPDFDPARLAGDGGPEMDVIKPITAKDLVLDSFDEDDIEDLIK